MNKNKQPVEMTGLELYKNNLMAWRKERDDQIRRWRKYNSTNILLRAFLPRPESAESLVRRKPDRRDYGE